MIIVVRTKRGTHRVSADAVTIVDADADGAFLEFVDGRIGSAVATIHLDWSDLGALRDASTRALRRRQRRQRG